MTVLDQSLLIVILLLLLGLAFALVAWQRTAERADRAERERDYAIHVAKLHQKDARGFHQQLEAANRTLRQYRRRLAMYEPADRPVTNVDEFLNGLFPDRSS